MRPSLSTLLFTLIGLRLLSKTSAYSSSNSSTNTAHDINLQDSIPTMQISMCTKFPLPTYCTVSLLHRQWNDSVKPTTNVTTAETKVDLFLYDSTCDLIGNATQITLTDNKNLGGAGITWALVFDNYDVKWNSFQYAGGNYILANCFLDNVLGRSNDNVCSTIFLCHGWN